MRCNICNRKMETSEIKQHKVTGEWEPCSQCRGVVSDTLTDYDKDDKLYELFELDKFDE
jgi:hypothetical protein